MKGRLRPLAAIVVVVALIAPACARAPSKKVLKVGVMFPYTGHSARYGDETKGAVTMAFDEVGNKIGEYEVELVWVDSESDPEKATRALTDAIVKENITAGLVNWHSSVAVACMDVVAKYKVPHFFGLGTTEVVNEKYHSDPETYSYWIGKWWPSYPKYTPGYALSIEDAISAGVWDPGDEKRVAFLAEDNDAGRSYIKNVSAYFEEAGWTVVLRDYYTAGETDFYPVLSRLKGLDLDVVSFTDSPTSQAAFLKQAEEVGIDFLVITSIAQTGEWYELTGPASDYTLEMTIDWVTDEGKAFRDAFEQKWGISPTPICGGLTYDAARFFIDIAQKTLDEYGEITRDALYKFSQDKVVTGQVSFRGGIVMEEYQFTPDSIPDPVYGPGKWVLPMVQHIDGKNILIWPASWKEADLQLPPSMR